MNSAFLEEPAPYRIMKTDQVYFRAHFHNQAEIVYCEKGTVSLLVSGASYMLCEGDAAFIFPNQRHYYQPLEKKTDSMFYITIFYPGQAEDFYFELTNMLPECPVVRRAQLPSFLPQLFSFFYESFRKEENQKTFKGYVSVAASYLLPKMELKPSAHMCSPDTAQTVLSYIARHFTEELSLKRLAKELGICTAALTRLFAQNIHCSFTEYVNELRIEYAKSFLRLDSYSIHEIARLCGYKSDRTFFRNFRRHSGMTPGEYRKML